MEQSYKEKYEQAIERLKQWDREHPCAGYVVSDRDKFIFPELAESEGEKVRKELIKETKGSEIRLFETVTNDEFVAWLEKQGQVKESTISQHEIETCKENNNSLTSEDENVRKALLELVHDTTGDELWIDYNVHKEEALDWLERQGEHANFRNKIQVGDKVTRNENGVLVNLSQLRRVAKPSEKQCEKKSITFNNAHIIDSALNGRLQHLAMDIYGWWKEYLRGKQQASYTTIVETGDGGINALVTLPIEMKTAEESLGISSDEYNKIVDECIFGEQKPEDKVEPKFKVGDKIYLKPEYRMPDDDTPIANTVKEIRRIDDKHYRFDGSYIFIEDQDKYELVEQEPKENKGNIGGISSNWSEEDESILQGIWDEILANKHDAKECEWKTYDMFLNWLKSLQGRVQPQPKQEWSEEDEQHIDSLLKRLDALCRIKLERTRFAISEDIDWLKSLRPQNRWKPSELQLGCLSDAIEHYNSLGYPASKLKELLDDLKKIKGEV